MRSNSFNALGRWATILFYLTTNLTAVAKDKDSNVTVQGKVFLVDKESSIIMVDTTTGSRRVVAYSPDTKFIYGHNNKGKESAINQVQEAQYISCIGKTNDGAKLVAKECVHREQK